AADSTLSRTAILPDNSSLPSANRAQNPSMADVPHPASTSPSNRHHNGSQTRDSHSNCSSWGGWKDQGSAPAKPAAPSSRPDSEPASCPPARQRCYPPGSSSDPPSAAEVPPKPATAQCLAARLPGPSRS